MERKNILIIEDDLDTKMYLEFLLSKKYGLSYLTTAEFYNLQSSYAKFNLIILDISIKNIVSGLQVIKKIKSNSSYRGLPLICLSAQTSDEEKEQAIIEGIDDFLTKPVSNKKLLEVITGLLSGTNAVNS